MNHFGKGASAPGKMLIAGEYVVLDGANAVVTAVQRRANARWVASHTSATARGLADDAPRFPEADASRRRAETLLGVHFDGELEIDVSALRGTHIKLGLGSSAAAAAAAAAAVYVAAGKEPGAHRDAILRCALDGHADVAPRGSGVDVAASVLGGVTRYVREPLKAEPLVWPKSLATRIVWTGKAASTRELLDQVAAFQQRNPNAHEAAMANLRTTMDALTEGFSASEDVIEKVRRVSASLERLSEESGASIVESTLREIATLAEAHRGAAKPSGAGGGDVALAFFPSEVEACAFDQAIAQSAYECLDVPMGGEGVRAL